MSAIRNIMKKNIIMKQINYPYKNNIPAIDQWNESLIIIPIKVIIVIVGMNP